MKFQLQSPAPSPAYPRDNHYPELDTKSFPSVFILLHIFMYPQTCSIFFYVLKLLHEKLHTVHIGLRLAFLTQQCVFTQLHFSVFLITKGTYA